MVLSLVMFMSCFPMTAFASEVDESLQVVTDLPEGSIVQVMQTVSEESSEQKLDSADSAKDSTEETVTETPDEESLGEVPDEEIATEEFNLLLSSNDENLNQVADPNDGKFAVVCTIESGNQTVEYYAPGETVTLSVPTKEHYVFTGWKIVCDVNVTITNNKFVMPEARVDVVAQWEPETYTIAIYYLTLTGKNLRSAKFSEVTYGYDFNLDSDYSLPAIDGYTLSKITHEGEGTEWKDFDNFRSFINVPSVQKDEVFYVWYEPSDVTYNVYHYKQNLDGTYSENASESETFDGKFGDKVTLESYVKSYTGFTWDGNTDEVTLATSGNVIRIYYERNSYKLFYQKTDSDTDSITYPFETNVELSVLGTPTRVGYNFNGWQTSSGEDVTGNTFSMPAHDVTFVAKWVPAEVTYTVYYWGETQSSAQAWTDSNHATDSTNRTPSSYTYIGKATATGLTGTIVGESEVQNAASGIMDSTIYSYETMDYNVTVDANGTTVVNAYYRRNVFWYRFIRNGAVYQWSGHNGYIYHKYGANVIAYWPTLDGNNAIVWKRTDGTNRIVTAPTSAQEGINVELKYDSTSSTKFTLWAYKENINGGYDGATKYEYVTYSGFLYLNIRMIASRLPEGFEYDSYYSNTHKAWINFTDGDTIVDEQNVGSTDIRLKRKFYTITFNDGNVDISSSNPIRFEASIAGVNVPEVTAPDAFKGYQFIGFTAAHNGVLYKGDTPQTAFETFKTAIGDKMLATNVTLTATWKAPIYTVNFYDDSTLSTLLGSEKVEMGKTVTNPPATPTRVNHIFNGWFYMDGEVEKLYWNGKTILSDMNVYAKWIADELIYADILVKHNYLAEDGTVERIEEDTKQAVVGSVATLDAKEVEGYFPDFISQNIEVLESGNVVTFNYTPLGEVEYIVRYVDADGNNLIPEVTKASSQLVVTETYRYIPKCTPRTISQTLKLSSNPENNVITFVYDVEGTNVYAVKHYLQEVDGTYTLYESEENLEVGNYTQVHATAKTYEGYEFNSNISNTDAWVIPGKNVVLNLYYDRMEYAVEYRYKDGYVVPEGAPALPKTVNYKFGETVTVEVTPTPPMGYTFVGWTYATDGTEATGTFEMPKENVVIEGYFEQLEYYIVVEWAHEDGVYHGGEYTWDCNKLEYVHDTSTAGWSTTPYVKATVKNYGSKAVKLDFEANIDLWAKFFADGGNPFNNLSTVTLDGNGAEFVFEFRNDIELKWNYDLLNAEALNVAVNGMIPSEHTNTFKLNITAV